MSVFVSKMAGNPDQQEDTVDDQYQEEMEDEVHNTTSNPFFFTFRKHTFLYEHKCLLSLLVL